MKKLEPFALLLEIVSRGDACRAVTILSPDRVRRQRVLHALLSGWTKNEVKPIGWTKVDLATKKNGLDNLREKIHSPSLFQPRIFVLAENADALDASSQRDLVKILGAASAVIKVVCCASKILPTSPLYKHAQKQRALIELPALEGHELKRWVMKELKAASLVPDSTAVIDKLIEIGDSQPDKIASQVSQLGLYCEPGPVKLDDIARLFNEHTVSNEFELLGYLGNRNVYKAELILRRLLDEGKNPFLLLSLLGRTFSTYLNIRQLEESGLPLSQVRQKAGGPPWVFNKQVKAAKNFSVEQLKEIIISIVSADSKFKNKSLGYDTVLSELILKIAT